MILESQEDIWKTLLDFNLMNSTMFKNTINIILLLATTFLFVGCEKKINDWEIDESHARLFRPLKFETSNIGATDVEIAYTRVVSADKYILDRKSTRLNSSHVSISYAVFCLKKKTHHRTRPTWRTY